MSQELIKKIEQSTAILFDMDGTLFDTEPMHAKALGEALKNFGKNITTDELHHRYFGKTDNSIFLELFPETYKRDYPTFQSLKNSLLTDVFNKLTTEEKNNHSAIGVKKFLQYLRRSGKKLALVSSSEQEIVDVTLKTFGVNLFFDLALGRSGTYLNKPNPSPYLKAMRFFKTGTNNTVIFEDSPSGLKAARDTGAFVVRGACFDRGELSENELQKIFPSGKLPLSINQFAHLIPEKLIQDPNFKELE